MNDQYMKRAIELAQIGIGKVNPNPLVGAVIVKNNHIIGEGYHEVYGQLHAERNALKDCAKRGNSPSGAEMYVTLEPCCHYGKTPPCVEAIVEAGITKVYVGSKDPNPLVAGKGIAFLREHQIEVVEHVCEELCDSINLVFFHYIQTHTPYVVMKYAMTMDGKIATVTGNSKWITGEQARGKVQESRNAYMGIMVGVGTVLADNPNLNCRILQGRNPIRIICDTRLRTPLDAVVIQTAKEQSTIIATAETNEMRLNPYIEAGCEILQIPIRNHHLNLTELMKKLGEKKIDSILLEGGGMLNASALKQEIVQEVQCYIAPKLFGGENAKTPLTGQGVEKTDDAYKLKIKEIEQIGEDVFIRNEVIYCSQES